MRKLSSTSYAILGLLSLHDWSTYELNRQIRRSFASWWPRTERQLYEQPKLLVEHGLATATADAVGRRPRTVYSITPAGRAALHDWLGDEPTPYTMEWDLILKVFFAEQGTKEQLLENLRRTAQSFRALTETAIVDTDELFAADYPYPQRHHLFALIAKLDFDVCATIERWLEWASDEVASWDDITGPPDGSALLRSVIPHAYHSGHADAPINPRK